MRGGWRVRLVYFPTLRAERIASGRKRWRYGLALAVASLLGLSLLTACAATVEPRPPVRLEMAGSTSMQSVMEELAEAYTTRYDHVTIDLQARGSRLGLQALRDDTVDIALVSRELRPEEEEGLQSTAVAYEAIAILVNDGNVVDSISLQQLRDVFTGDLLLWSQLGGAEVDIQVLSREDGSGTREVFEDTVLEGERVTLTAIVIPGNQGVGEFVAENPLAIGYASAVDIPLGAKALRIDGVKPNLQTVTEGTYPLIRPFTLVTQQGPDDDVKAFLDFVLSPAGQVIIGRRYARSG